MTPIQRWIDVLGMTHWQDPVIFEHVSKKYLRSPLDFYTHKWGPKLQEDVEDTREISFEKFLRALGFENLNLSQAQKLWKHVGNLNGLIQWAQPGGFRAFSDHDLKKAALVTIRTIVRDQQDLIEGLLEHVVVLPPSELQLHANPSGSAVQLPGRGLRATKSPKRGSAQRRKGKR